VGFGTWFACVSDGIIGNIGLEGGTTFAKIMTLDNGFYQRGGVWARLAMARKEKIGSLLDLINVIF
jgi:hypothetical protein